jgi:23S rRNA (pseudouridine1915-N3)-methyltransferase
VKVYLYYAGKPRDPHTNALAADYLARAGRYAHCEMREIRPGRFDPWERHPAATKILLDPAGRVLDSAAVAALFGKAEMQGRDLVFVVGGADGLPEGWRGRAGLLWSLSPLTLPHELARALVAEQIYRAFATLRGHPYPR